MPPAQVYAELLRLAARVGLRVRVEPFALSPLLAIKGGLCWLRGTPTVLLDESAPLLDKVGVLAEALARFDLEALYVPPFVRARLEGRAPRLRDGLPRDRLPRDGAPPRPPRPRGPAKAPRRGGEAGGATVVAFRSGPTRQRKAP